MLATQFRADDGLNNTPVSSATPLPVYNAAQVGTPTDRGGTIATGGTAQVLAAANPLRKLLVVQNPSNATEPLYIAVAGNATPGLAGNFADLGAGGSCTVPGSGAVSIVAATTGHRYLATEYQ